MANSSFLISWSKTVLLVCTQALLFVTCSTEDDDLLVANGDFKVYVDDSDFWISSAYDGVALSTTDGTIVWSGSWPGPGDSIVADVSDQEQLSLTLFNSLVLDLGNGPDTVFNHLTFADLSSGATVGSTASVLNTIQTVTLKVSGIFEVEDVVVRSINNQNTFWTLDGEQLTVVFNRYKDDALAVYIKANGESVYRSFFSGSQEDVFSAEWQSLPEGVMQQKVEMPLNDFWTGSIRAVDVDGTAIEIYGFRNIAGTQPSDTLSCWYPIDFAPVTFEIDVNGLFQGMKYLDVLDLLPSTLQAPSWTPVGSGVSSRSIAIIPEPEVNFWECSWIFESESGGAFGNISTWKVIGLANPEINFSLPALSDDLSPYFPTWNRFDAPDRFDLTLWSASRPSNVPGWSLPHRFVNRERRKNWGLVGLRETGEF